MFRKNRGGLKVFKVELAMSYLSIRVGKVVINYGEKRLSICAMMFMERVNVVADYVLIRCTE